MTESASAAPLLTTPLNAAHRRLKARMVPFGGWDMPVEYSGIIPEHRAVRTSAGLFDVSHMGEIEIRGNEALDLVQTVTCNDAAALRTGQAQYSALLTEKGTFVDDLLVYRMGEAHFLLVVNASNIEKDFQHIRTHNQTGALLENTSAEYAQLAIQGPRALGILRRLTSADLAGLRYYWFTIGKVADITAIISRTGYTGEDGFELYFPAQHAELLWNTLLDEGQLEGLIPCGLGARNTLRLEAGMALYGHEIDENTNVWEANLNWICKLNKPGFVGRDALQTTRRERALVGIEMVEPGIARDGYPIFASEDAPHPLGQVTSGSPSPTLGKNIGMGFVPLSFSSVGQELWIQIRNRRARARVTPLPFYRRTRG